VASQVSSKPHAELAAAQFDPLRYVVVLVLENRSYDHGLGALSEVIPAADGISGGSRRANRDPERRVYFQTPAILNRIDPDPKHEHPDVVEQLQGHNAGFVANYSKAYPDASVTQRGEVMSYFPRGALRSTHSLAEHFAICDRWFCSVPGPTWTNRFFVHSGTSIGRVKMPEGIFKPNLHIYNQDTVYDRLNERGISWRIYYHDFPHSLLLTHQLRPRNLRRYRSMRHFVHDVSAGTFPRYVLIEPAYFRDPNDDHPPHDSQAAQRLVAQVYGALRRNLALWNRLLLIVTYDEHGGFYDHVEPPAAVPPDDHHEEYTFDRLGVRVPTIFISPWLGPQVVHDAFDHTSILKYATEKWRLGPLGKRTAAAANPWPLMAKLTALRTDAPLSLSVVPQPSRPLSATRPLSKAQAGLFAFSGYLELQVPPDRRPHSGRLMAPAEEAGKIAEERLEEFFRFRIGTSDPPG